MNVFILLRFAHFLYVFHFQFFFFHFPISFRIRKIVYVALYNKSANPIAKKTKYTEEKNTKSHIRKIASEKNLIEIVFCVAHPYKFLNSSLIGMVCTF